MATEAQAAREVASALKDSGDLLTPSAKGSLTKQTLLARTCTVQRVSDTFALVKQTVGLNTVERTVDFTKKECTCGEWQQSGRPCRHAIAFAPLYFTNRTMASEPEK